MSDLAATNAYLSEILRAVQGGRAGLLEELILEVRELRQLLTRPAPPTAEELLAFRTVASAESRGDADSMDHAADLLSTAIGLLSEFAGADRAACKAVAFASSALDYAQQAADEARGRAKVYASVGDQEEVEHG